MPERFGREFSQDCHVMFVSLAAFSRRRKMPPTVIRRSSPVAPDLKCARRNNASNSSKGALKATSLVANPLSSWDVGDT